MASAMQVIHIQTLHKGKYINLRTYALNAPYQIVTPAVHGIYRIIHPRQ